ncbi:MAG TPA: DUF6498-containing protein [Chitinophagaceae bacterium]|nr:DUF6498-containing protein [Chitinophagaceae bacterium]
MLFKRSLTRSDYFLIAANLLPVIGCWFWNWDPKQVFMVYALETIIAGFFTVIKMGIVTIYRKTDTWNNNRSVENVSGIFFILFFLVHYGMFVAIQTGMFIAVSGIGKEYHLGFFEFFLHWPNYFNGDLLYMLLGFIISYGFNMVWNFIRPGLYKTIPMMLLMFQPYGRIIIQQITVIFGSMFLTFGAGKIFILIFAAVKVFFELFVNYDGIINKAMLDMKKESGKE